MRTRGTQLSRWVLGCLCALGLVASGRPAAAQPAPNVTLTTFAAGLTFPVGVVHAGDGSGRLFIVQQTGQIRVHTGTQLLGTPFLDIKSLLVPACQATPPSCGESGLLGLAFHPNYENNGFFYVYYTDLNADQVVARYSVSAGNPNLANAQSAQIVLRMDDPFGNHNGGQLHFDADGYLYIATGDGGAGGDPDNRAQNPLDLLGKILRIDIDQSGTVPCRQSTPRPYGIPAGNPFAGSSSECEEIWVLGLRNPWRFSFDRWNDDLYIGDVGQGLYEEVDYQPASSPGGENYGWRLMEGLHCYNPATNCNVGTLTLPILEHDRTEGCSVTGGYVYRGSLYPQLYGVYVYSDYCSSRIWGATRDNSGVWSKRVLAFSAFVSSFGEDEDGELYVVEHSGTVKKITSSTSYAVPSISSLSPFAAVAGDPTFTLRVNGAGFTPASTVRWNGAARTTTYVSRTRLRATIPASDVDTAGSASVTVGNPTPGGGLSVGKTFQITNVFLDVPLSHPHRQPIEGIADAGVTSGCGTRIFCPESVVSRDQMAILLLRARLGAGYDPPPATGSVFGDVKAGNFAADFIEQMSAAGISQGCGSGNYCPLAPVTRAPMAKFLLRALVGPTYTPPPPSGIFSDVPTTAPFASWIDEASRRGITSGCGGGKYCPNLNVTRAQMAAFLSRTFLIPLAQ